jgi:hypothetical protein
MGSTLKNKNCHTERNLIVPVIWAFWAAFLKIKTVKRNLTVPVIWTVWAALLKIKTANETKQQCGLCTGCTLSNKNCKTRTNSSAEILSCHT